MTAESPQFKKKTPRSSTVQVTDQTTKMALQLRQRIFNNMASEMRAMDHLIFGQLRHPFFNLLDTRAVEGTHRPGSLAEIQHDGDVKCRLAALNVQEEKDAYVLSVELPGIPKERVKVDLDAERGLVTITGDTKVEHESGSKDGEAAYFKSTSYSKFSRTVPVDKAKVDLDKIEARLQDGLLSLNLPKQVTNAQPQVRSIKIG